MIAELLWLLFDVAVGLLLAGAVAPLTLVVLPDQWRGSEVLIGIGVASVVIVSVVRRLVVGGKAEDSEGR